MSEGKLRLPINNLIMILSVLVLSAWWLLAPAPVLAAQQAVVNGSYVNLRAGPSTTSQVVGKAVQGEKLEVLAKSDQWYQVRKGSQVCWLAGWLVTLSGSAEEVSRAGSGQAVVKGTFVNLRGGPGTTNKIVGKALQGEKLDILAQSGDWYQVRKGNLTCWVANWLVETKQTAPAQSKPAAGTAASGASGQIEVIGELVNVRSGPGTGFKVVGQAARGDRLSVLDKSGDWCKLATGWIYAPLTKTVTATAPSVPVSTPAGGGSQGVVSGTAANIRSGPGTDYNVVSRAGQGDRLTLLEKSSDWYKVRLPDGNTGWIVAWLMEEEEPATTPGTGVQPPQGPTGGSGGVEGQYVPPSPPADKDNTGEKDNTGGKDNTGKTVSSGSLKSVSGKSGGNNSTVTVESDGTTIKYNLFYMSDRLVLDIQGLDPGKVPESITLNSMLVDKIRVGLFQSNPAVTRVVLDLKARVSCEESLSSGGNKLQLVLTPRGTGTVAGSKIVLDPGHGGSDPGAIGSNGLQEKTVNLDISLKVAQILRERGATVIMTRTGDTYVDLYERPEIANRNDADLFVSIHSNSTTRSDVAGTSTYYVRAPEAGMEEVAGEGKILAGDIQSCLMKALGRQDKGVLQANYVVLVKSKVPAALAEVAYLSNPEEVRLLGDSSFRLKAAQAIADGIEKYLKEN